MEKDLIVVWIEVISFASHVHVLDLPRKDALFA